MRAIAALLVVVAENVPPADRPDDAFRRATGTTPLPWRQRQRQRQR